ncbi:MAG: hypothetical protein Q8M03_13215 [Legionella sp.]|nr:hypothetical protein [Legionella sp.]
MDNTPTRKISAIISSERRLEKVIQKLTQQTVSLHDVSVQGPPNKIADKFGVRYMEPGIIQQSNHPPTKEPFMDDDFGWVLGFSFSIPMIVGIIIGVFIIGDIHSTSDNYFYGILGAIVGGAIGIVLNKFIQNRHNRINKIQEEKGGFVLWITITKDEQINEVVDILNEYGASNIAVE